MDSGAQSSKPLTVVYLDQDAASYLALGGPYPIWNEIRSELIRAFSEQRIICPMPMETLSESAPCPTKDRIAIEQFFRSVSDGIRFRSYTDIIIDKTLQFARPTHQAPAFGIIRNGWGERESAASFARTVHANAREMMIRRMEEHRIQNPISKDEKRMSVMGLFNRASLNRNGMFWRDLCTFIEARGEIDSRKYEIDWLMPSLINRKLTLSEASRLEEAVRSHEWINILENSYDLLLGAQWEHDYVHKHRPNYKPNDEVDRWRAVVALVHADILVTDGYAADLCRKVNINKYTPTCVFSVKQTDSLLAAIKQAGF